VERVAAEPKTAGVGAGGCIVVEAEPSGLSAARNMIRGIAEELELPDDDARDLVAAAGEALSNAYAHGSAAQGGLIQISWDVSDQTLTVRIGDDGPGFCPLDAGATGRDPLVRGQGIRLMRKLIDDLRFDFGEGTQVVLTKSLRGQNRGVI
jgi:anti-sigma regulatory factor (Ser/Thr protein kinase)